MFIDVIPGTSLTFHMFPKSINPNVCHPTTCFCFPENSVSNGKGAANTWKFAFTKHGNDSFCERIVQFPKSIPWVVSNSRCLLLHLNHTEHVNQTLAQSTVPGGHPLPSWPPVDPAPDHWWPPCFSVTPLWRCLMLASGLLVGVLSQSEFSFFLKTLWNSCFVSDSALEAPDRVGEVPSFLLKHIVSRKNNQQLYSNDLLQWWDAQRVSPGFWPSHPGSSPGSTKWSWQYWASLGLIFSSENGTCPIWSWGFHKLIFVKHLVSTVCFLFLLLNSFYFSFCLYYGQRR